MTLVQSENINRAMGSKEWSLIALLSIIWGGSFFFIELALEELPPLSIVFSRVTMASVILLLVVYFGGHKIPFSLRIWGSFFMMGLLNNVIPFMLIVWGQTHIEGGLASILNGTTPIFSVLLTHFLSKDERLTGNRILGVLIGWVGVAVLIGINALKGFGMASISQIAILGASLSYACAAIYARRFRELKPIVVATGMLCCSSIIMAPLALTIDQPWNFTPGAIVLIALITLAVVCTALAYLIYFRVLATAGATNSLLVTFLIPISAIILGSLVLGERLGWNAFIGMGLIFIGLIAIDGRLLNRLKLKINGS